MTAVSPKNQALTLHADDQPFLIKGRSPFNVMRPDSVKRQIILKHYAT
jgi:hypothetical protein